MPADLIPALYHQEGMIPWPKLSRPTKRCNEVSYDDTGRHTVGYGNMSRFWESNVSLIDWQTSDPSTRDLGCGTLKEGLEERVTQIILHELEHCPYVRGDALHKSPLLQAGIDGLRVIEFYPGYYGHKSLPSLHLLLQPPILRQIWPH